MKQSSFQRAFSCAVLSSACIVVSGDIEARGHFERTGDTLQFAVPVGAALYSLTQGDVEGVGELLEHCGRAGLAVEVMKKTFNGTSLGVRPNGRPNNFPSGHASGAYCGASYMHARYGLERALPAYVLATVTGVSRMQADKHTSLAVGASFFLNHYLARSRMAGQTSGDDSDMMVLPYVVVPDRLGSPKIQYGLQFRMRF